MSLVIVVVALAALSVGFIIGRVSVEPLPPADD